MKNPFRIIPGSICAPRGFSCAAVFCDIKKLGTGKGSEKGRKNDLALIVSDVPAAVAGMFTTNQIRAAPVKVSRKVAARNFARAIVVNSGNANAATGKQGVHDAQSMCELSAQSFRKLDGFKPSSLQERDDAVSARDVLVCSTGRIGVPMPMRNVERGICACALRLGRSTTNARQIAEAIMTTDTRRKEIAVELKIEAPSRRSGAAGNRTVRIGGIAKGAGMIQPGMATMLAFITSDVAIEPRALKRALKIAVERSFNRITVDGDMSTNDSVVMLANGLAVNRKLDGLKPSSLSLRCFQGALNFVCLELAKMIVRDGEGTSRVVTLHVRGARNDRDAELAARAIANSSLVRASWCGGDPNWGRILCALGYSKANVDETVVDVGYASPARAAKSGSRKIVFAFRRGRPTNAALKTLAKITLAPAFDLHVDLHRGHGEIALYAADLTEDYVAFNKGNVNDPTSLGG